ncbi:hypothetical protein KR222_006321 [Zaprionus bogoriensis]|nr:hypothetical protein KR222_006321 [Zaprionus bogoriensis]
MQLKEIANLPDYCENGKNMEMDNMLCDLIDIHKVNGNEDALKRVLQSIYSLLDKNNDVRFGTKLFDKLISVVIADRGDLTVGRERIAKLLRAVQTHARQSRVSGSYLLRKLCFISLCEQPAQGDGDPEQDLAVTLHPHAGQILEHLLDDFVRELGLKDTCSPQLFDVVQQLLRSEQRDNRQMAYSIMQKLLLIIERCRDVEGSEELHSLEPHWPAYIVIMEQLEQPEAHLVLPMLSGHLPRLVTSSQDDDWLSWMRILFVRLLDNHDERVVHWSLEYFLMYSSIGELRRVNMLTQFFDAVNKTELYDAGDYCLPEVNIRTFVQNSGTLEFLEALVSVPWHSLPMVHWLRSMHPRQPHIAKSLLFTICGCVKSLQHDNLRFEAQNRMFDLFELTIESLTLGEYIQFIKSLSDSFSRDHKRFTAKIASCQNIIDEMEHFDKAFFMMIFRTDASIGIELHKQLSLLPKVQHGWWRLFSFFFSLKLECETERKKILDFYYREYELDIHQLEAINDLHELQAYLVDKLGCDTEEEISFVLHRSVDWFVCQKLTRWSQIDSLDMTPLELLSQGTILTAQRIATLLNDVDRRLEDESLLKSLMCFLKQCPDSVNLATGILKYAAAHLSAEENEQMLCDILEVSHFPKVNILSYTKSVPTALVIRGILAGSPLSGEKCIEYGYLISQYNYFFTSCRNTYINFVIDRKLDIDDVLDELLRINNEMIEKKQSYVENSKEHRIKMRAARAFLRITYKYTTYWSDQLWVALLSMNDHENIKYIFECLVARCMPSAELLINQLQHLSALKSCQQLSLISVVHIYCLSKYSHIKVELLQKFIDLLLPLTLTKDLEIRLFTQLVLHRLLQLFEDNNIKLPGVSNMKNSIESNLGNKLVEYQNDGRLLLPKICFQTPDGLQAADIILYMTDAPCDEYFADSLRPNLKLKTELSNFRSFFKHKDVSTSSMSTN